MLRAFLLIFFVFSSLCLGQNETSNAKPTARQIDEFDRAANGDVKARMDNFLIELANNLDSEGFIINYGTPREISIRKSQLITAMKFRKYDQTRVTFVDGGFYKTVKTEFWMVPPGAEPPIPRTFVKKIDEFGGATSGDLKARIDFFFVEINNNSSQGYILNYGSPRQIAAREKLIKKAIAFRKYDSSKITFVNAGTGKTIKTELWIDAETP